MTALRKPLAVLTALVAWSAVLGQMTLSLTNALGRGETVPRALADFFSYFTVTTNVLVALTLTVPMVLPESRAA
ncbi:MAG: hypothetical protein WCK74_01870, partial [Gemmatimonadaceae bacterium]